jgi:hypothetical protein
MRQGGFSTRGAYCFALKSRACTCGDRPLQSRRIGFKAAAMVDAPFAAHSRIFVPLIVGGFAAMAEES